MSSDREDQRLELQDHNPIERNVLEGDPPPAGVHRIGSRRIRSPQPSVGVVPRRTARIRVLPVYPPRRFAIRTFPSFMNRGLPAEEEEEEEEEDEEVEGEEVSTVESEHHPQDAGSDRPESPPPSNLVGTGEGSPQTFSHPNERLFLEHVGLENLMRLSYIYLFYHCLSSDC